MEISRESKFTVFLLAISFYKPGLSYVPYKQ